MAPTEEAYVAPGLRSPFCKVDGELSELEALELSVPVVQQTVVGPTGPGPGSAGKVELVLWGSVIPSLRVSNWGREVWLDSGLDPGVPAQTIIQACGTSLAAATHAAAQVRTGRLSLALCGGVESVTFTQVGLSPELSRTIRRTGRAKRPGAALRSLGEIRPSHIKISAPGIEERTTGMSMGEHAEEMVKEWDISREDQDRLALTSHKRAVAAAAEEEDFFRPLLVSPGTFAADRDTVPRADTSLDQLAALRPSFDRDRGTLTAGNSSPLTDGAAACWVVGQEGLRLLPDDLPRARLVDWEQAAVDIEREGLLMAPALAIPRLLARHDLGYEEVELWEVHEAFAGQVLCTIRALESREWLRERAGVDRDFGPFPADRMNPNGGSLALGHPFAATGARILSQAVRELAALDSGSRAVVSICAAGGLGHVALLETA